MSGRLEDDPAFAAAFWKRLGVSALDGFEETLCAVERFLLLDVVDGLFLELVLVPARGADKQRVVLQPSERLRRLRAALLAFHPEGQAIDEIDDGFVHGLRSLGASLRAFEDPDWSSRYGLVKAVAA